MCERERMQTRELLLQLKGLDMFLPEAAATLVTVRSWFGGGGAVAKPARTKRKGFSFIAVQLSLQVTVTQRTRCLLSHIEYCP